MPPRSQTGIDWNHLAAAKTITIKNLLLHTSGLDPKAGNDPISIEGALKSWTGTKGPFRFCHDVLKRRDKTANRISGRKRWHGTKQNRAILNGLDSKSQVSAAAGLAFDPGVTE